MTNKPNNLLLLNTIAAAGADLVVSDTELSVAGFTKTIKPTDNYTTYTKTAYTAGTAAVKYIDVGASLTLTALKQYRLSVSFPNAVDANGVPIEGGYSVEGIYTMPATALSAGDTATAMEAYLETLTSDSYVTMAVASTDQITLTAAAAKHGDFIFKIDSVNSTVTTAHVQPSGVPATVELELNGYRNSSGTQLATVGTGTYTKWVITELVPTRHGSVGGAKVLGTEITVVYADANATNYAAFAQYLDGLLSGGANVVGKVNVINAVAAMTLTPGQSGSTIVLNIATGADITLPADAIGLTYRFTVGTTVTSNDYSINGAATSDLFTGGITMYDDGTPEASPIFKPDVSDDDVMSMNGTTTGGKIGTDFTVTCIAADRWHVTGIVSGSGTLATPFL